mgnify:CR=1 FL=1
MRKFYLLICTILIATCGHSQSVFLLEKAMPTQEASSANVLLFSICKDLEAAEKSFDDFIKDRYDLKVKNNNKYSQIAEKVSIPALSPYRGDLICYFNHTDTGNTASIGFAMGYDIYLNSEDNPEGMANFRNMVKNFMTHHFQEYYQETLDDLEKQLKSANKEVNKRETNITRLKKDDVNLGKKILKEDDPAKKQKLEAEKLEANHKADLLYNELPPYRQQINELDLKIQSVREELNDYLSKILALK